MMNSLIQGSGMTDGKRGNDEQLNPGVRNDGWEARNDEQLNPGVRNDGWEARE